MCGQHAIETSGAIEYFARDVPTAKHGMKSKCLREADQADGRALGDGQNRPTGTSNVCFADLAERRAFH